MEQSENVITLNEDERRVVAAVSKERGIDYNDEKTNYSASELIDLGFIRENWSFDELREKKFDANGIVTSFDDNANRAMTELLVDAPFAKGVKKWQLPIPLPGFRVVMTLFPPNTVVESHVHPTLDGVAACGQLRVVVKGSIIYNGQKFGPGEWFFIPNDIPYSFVTDPEVETLENYAYQYNGLTGLPMRFSCLQSVTG